MIKNFKTSAELQTQIKKLKQDKEQLRTFLHEIIEAYYRTVNQEENDCCPCPKMKGEKHE